MQLGDVDNSNNINNNCADTTPDMAPMVPDLN